MNESKLSLHTSQQIYTPILSTTTKYNNDSKTCLYCGQHMTTKMPVHRIETLFEGNIGVFCSIGCSESMAGCIAHVVQLRRKPYINIMPACMYKQPGQLFTALRQETETCYGGQKKGPKDQVTIHLKKLNYD